MFKAVYCPKDEDHQVPGVYEKSHRKILFAHDDDGIALYCKMHGWIRFEFECAGKRVSLKDTAIKAFDIKNDKHLDLTEASVMAVGEFTRRGKCQKASR